jgi:gliding motility-associated lipoprotein GldH
LKHLVIFSMLLLNLSSCGPKVIFDQKVKLSGTWLYNDSIKFDFEITDNTKTCDLILVLTHSDVFSYENLYVNATTIFPDGSKTTNPVSLQLADKNGGWIGDCTGDNCSITIAMSSAAYFKSSGKYAIMLEQYSRKDSLEGISAIELKVMESQKELCCF